MSTNYKKAIMTTTMLAGAIIAGGATAEAALGDQPLAQGKRHQDVVELQNILKAQGFFTYHTSTGFYGPITEQAVKDFQTKQGLAATGKADKTTQTALIKQQVAAQPKTATPSQSTAPKQALSAQIPSGSQQPAITLAVGSRGQAVADLQRLLDEAKLFNYHTYTGYYGEITAKGVREFQKKVNMTITGKADSKTIEALKTHLKNQPTAQVTAPVTQVPPVQKVASTNSTVPAQQQASFLLKVGSNGEAVRELQHQLTVLGLFSGHQITGYFGPITEAAVKQFQQQHALISDGLATTKTIQKIIEVTAKQLIPAITLPSETRNNFQVLNVIADASELLGTPYIWGGTTSTGFDCSGFIQYIYQKNTVKLPRTVAQMWQVGKEVTDLQVGDIVFFETYMPGPSHAGIYIGNNQFIHSGATLGVSISNLQSNYYSTRYLGAKRVG
jgi:peptidoglycan hydrolase-like protein with peptidoglycan-binding domain